jgi:hypothetical protein
MYVLLLLSTGLLIGIFLMRYSRWTVLILVSLLIILLVAAMFYAREAPQDKASHDILVSKLVASELSLSNNVLKNITLKTLQQFFDKNTIAAVSLNKVDAANALKIAKALPANVNLILINLTPAANQALLQQLILNSCKNKKLEFISLEIDDNIATLLLKLSKINPNLQTLIFDKVQFKFNTLSQKFWPQLLAAIINLDWLTIKASKLDDYSLRNILPVLTDKNHLINLNLWGNAFGDASVDILIKYMTNNNTLRSLNIGHNQFSEPAVKRLIKVFKDNPSMLDLQINNNNISEKVREEVRILNAQRKL